MTSNRSARPDTEGQKRVARHGDDLPAAPLADDLDLLHAVGGETVDAHARQLGLPEAEEGAVDHHRRRRRLLELGEARALVRTPCARIVRTHDAQAQRAAGPEPEQLERLPAGARPHEQAHLRVAGEPRERRGVPAREAALVRGGCGRPRRSAEPGAEPVQAAGRKRSRDDDKSETR
jgi:hypothetical protein